ncbi:MAG: hypothetical protein IT558_00685 [Alphaproteobacteria bacterium]|nr:hypothetical protein [Alphaproteobacteria bacterium]
MKFFNRRDPLDLEAEAKQETENDLLEKRQAIHEAEDFLWIMSDKRGRRFIWGVLERAGLFSQSFDGTAEGTIFADGLKNEGRLIMGLIFAHCPGAFTQMILEREKDLESETQHDD